jgi:hypothetical protein
MVKFLLDGIEYENPIGWDELSTKIVRDDSISALLVYQDLSLEFTGGAFDYLYGKLQLDGYCSIIELTIIYTDDCDHVINGLIFLSDAEFNERACRAKCKIEDNSFYAKIKNNIKLNTSLYSGKSKNSLDITIPSTYYADLTGLSNNRVNENIPCIKVYDAFRYLIDFMTDKTVQFDSKVFGTGGDWEGLVITNGYRIFDKNSTFQYQVNFEKLFDEVNKRIPLIVYIENPLAASPILRIEKLEDSYGSSEVQQHLNIDEIITKVDNTLLYSKVKVGTSVTDDTFTNYFPENTPYFGWIKEEYNIQINCNIDRALDLQCDYATGFNAIWRCLYNQDNQDNIFLLDTIVDSPGAYSGQIYAEDIFNIGYYYMNSRLNNASVMIRWLQGLPGNPSQFFGSTGDSYFKVTNSSNVSFSSNSYNTITWNTENLDPDNRFSDPKFTAKYTGIYNFDIQIVWNLRENPNWFVSSPNTDSYGKYDWYYEVRDSGGTLKSSTFLYSTGNICGVHWNDGPNFYPPNGYSIQTNGSSSVIQFSATLLQDWYVQIVGINNVANPISSPYWGTLNEFWDISQVNSSYWLSFDNSLGGGTYLEVNPDDVPIYVYKYDYPIKLSEWNTLLSNTINKIGFSMSGQLIRNGWMKDISYNYNTGMASVQLISSKNGN